jgi:hypothetical protein
LGYLTQGDTLASSCNEEGRTRSLMGLGCHLGIGRLKMLTLERERLLALDAAHDDDPLL